MIKTAVVYSAAAFFEIDGCFSLWLWLREGKSAWWIAPGTVSLLLFAWFLTQVDTAAAGRAYAAYGGVILHRTNWNPVLLRRGKWSNESVFRGT